MPLLIHRIYVILNYAICCHFITKVLCHWFKAMSFVRVICPNKASYMCYRELRIILAFPVLIL